MKYLIILLCSIITIPAIAQKGKKDAGAFFLKEVLFFKDGSVVHNYQDGNDLFVVQFKQNGKHHDLFMKKNKRHHFSLYKNKSGKVMYRLGVKGEPQAFNKGVVKILPQELKLLLAYLEQDQQQYHPQFQGGGEANVNNGIPSVAGPETDQSWNGGSGDECRQTSSCSCGSSSVIVTCGCGSVISCYERTTTACDSDEAGNKTNCREVTGCAGRCD
jgi:hypothetical protein